MVVSKKSNTAKESNDRDKVVVKEKRGENMKNNLIDEEPLFVVNVTVCIVCICLGLYMYLRGSKESE